MTDRDDIRHEQIGAISLWTRRGRFAAWDRGIAMEVQHAYFPDALRGADVASVLDVGAHIGAFTLFARHLFPTALIIAVEAEADNADMLRRNTAGDARIRAHHARLGYTEGEFMLARARDNSGGHMVVPKGAAVDDRYELVEVASEVVTVESLLGRHHQKRLGLLKADCEGCEVELFERISDEALGRIDRIVGERHQTQAAFLRGAGARLKAAGFTLRLQESPVPELGTFLAARRGT